MIKNQFLKVGLLAAAAMSFSMSANAGLYEKYQDMSMEQAMEACPKSQLAQAPKKKVDGVMTVDFTNQPEACVVAFAKTLSNRRQVILAERQEEPWRTETLSAAKEIQDQTKKPVLVAYYKDVDPDDKVATTSFWSWGREVDNYELQDTHGIFTDLLVAKNSKDKMVERGVAVQAYKDQADRNLVATVTTVEPKTTVSEPLVAAR